MQFIFHINEINDDDAADISQSKLVGNFLNSLHIGFKDCLFKIFAAHVAAGVYIYNRQCLSGFNDDIAAGAQPHFLFQSTADIYFYAIGIQQRYLIVVMHNPVAKLRHKGFHKVTDPFKSCPVINDTPLDIWREQIAYRPLGYVKIFINQAWHRRFDGSVLDFAPQMKEKFHVRLQVLPRRIFRHRPDDKTCILGPEFFNFFAQPLPVFIVFKFSGDANVVGHRHIYKVSAWQGDMAGEPSTLGAQRFLAYLHQDILAFGQQFFDIDRGGGTFLHDLSVVVTTALLALVIAHPVGKNLAVGLYIIDIEKAGPFQPHVYKCGLHTGQYPDNTAPVDVAHHTFSHRPFQVEFHQVAMLDQGNANFI